MKLIQFISSLSILFLCITTPISAELSRKDRVLHNAVRDWNLVQVKRSIVRGANVNSQNSDGRTPIFSSVPSRDEGARNINRVLGIAKYLIRKKANTNIKTKKGDSALHNAIRLDAVIAYYKLLVNAGADVNATNLKGDTVLALAIKLRRRDVIAYLKSKGAKATLKLPKTVYEAVKFENFENLKKLVQNGADVNEPFIDRSGSKHFALGLGVAQGNTKIVKYLLDHKATDSFKDLLYLAANNAHIKMADLLIKAGAKINNSGRPAIFAAYNPQNRNKGHFKMLAWLISKGANVNEIHPSKGHLLDVAAIGTNKIPLWYVKYIIRKGAHLNGQAHNSKFTNDTIPFEKRSPLEKAVAFGGNTRLALLLIKSGADFKIHNNFVLETLAAGPATLVVLKALHKKGVNLKTIFTGNKTILHLGAPGHANVSFFRYAVRAGVNWRAIDAKGNTAYDLVQTRHRPGVRAIMRYLYRLGARSKKK